MSNLFSLSYSNKKKPANLWDKKTIAFIILSLNEARHIFVTKRWKLQEVFVLWVLSSYSIGGPVAQWVRSLDLTTHTSLSPIRRGFAPVLYMFVIGTSVYYRHISKLFIDIVVFVNKELNYFICLFNYFFVCLRVELFYLFMKN